MTPSNDLLKILHELEHQWSSGLETQILPHFMDRCMDGLKMIDQSSDPRNWAILNFFLGWAYYQSASDAEDRASDIARDQYQKSIDYANMALQVFTKQTDAIKWCRVSNLLGLIYSELPVGIQIQNRKRAISIYHEILDFATQQKLTSRWISTSLNLADACLFFPKSEEAKEYLYEAVDIFHRLLRNQTFLKTHQNDVERIKETLSRIYYRIYFEHKNSDQDAKSIVTFFIEHLEYSDDPRDKIELISYIFRTLFIAHLDKHSLYIGTDILEKLSELLDKEYDCTKDEKIYHHRIRLLFDLGLDYFLRYQTEGNQSIQHIEKAIQKFENFINQEQDVFNVRKAKENLVILYQLRSLGDPLLNEKRVKDLMNDLNSLVQPILSLKSDQATSPPPRQVPYDFFTCNEQGLHLISRQEGNKSENIETAIFLFERIITEETKIKREGFRAEFDQAYNICMATVNLSIAYQLRVIGNKTENKEKALSLLQNLLKSPAISNTIDSVSKESIFSEMATIYKSRSVGDPEENLSQAIRLYEKVLETRKPEKDSVAWVRTMNNLGEAYEIRAQRGLPNNNVNAIAVYQRALKHLQPDQSPEHYRQIHVRLGNIFFFNHQWAEATACFQKGVEAGDLFFNSSILYESKVSILSLYQYIPSRLVYCLARMGREQEALLILERNRVKILREKIRIPADKLNQVAKVNPQLSQVLINHLNLLASVDPLKQNRQVQEAKENLERILQQIRTLPGLEDFMGVPSIDQIRAVAEHISPIVYLVTTMLGSLALIVTKSSGEENENIDTVWMDSFDSSCLESLLVKENSQEVVGGYVLGQSGSHKILYQELENVLDEIGAHLIQPVADQLRQKGISRILLIPTGLLGLLPFHAARYPYDKKPVFFLDEVQISYASSASMIYSIWKERELSKPVKVKYLGLGNPPTTSGLLPFSEIETQEIASILPTGASKVLLNNEASLANFKSSLENVTHLHLSCHGNFFATSPLDSRLALAGDEYISLADILYKNIDLSSVEFVLLSACQTSITDYSKVPEESIGFPSVLQQAGISAIVGTLWSVNDLPTALLNILMFRFMAKKKMDPAAALQKAQQMIRSATAEELDLVNYFEKAKKAAGGAAFDFDRLIDYYKNNPNLKPFKHPYYWGGLIFFGLSVPFEIEGRVLPVEKNKTKNMLDQESYKTSTAAQQQPPDLDPQKLQQVRSYINMSGDISILLWDYASRKQIRLSVDELNEKIMKFHKAIVLMIDKDNRIPVKTIKIENTPEKILFEISDLCEQSNDQVSSLLSNIERNIDTKASVVNSAMNLLKELNEKLTFFFER